MCLGARGLSEDSLLLWKVLAWCGQSAPPRLGAERLEPRKLQFVSKADRRRPEDGVGEGGQGPPLSVGASQPFQTLAPRFPCSLPS